MEIDNFCSRLDLNNPFPQMTLFTLFVFEPFCLINVMLDALFKIYI